MTIDLSPEEFRQLGYKAIDLIAAQLASVEQRPVRQPVPAALRDQLMHQPLAEEPTDPAALIEQFGKLMDYPMGNNSPRFFAWVNSPAAPLGILAELLAAANNASVAGGDHSATYIEHGVLNWFKQMFGYPHEAGGILTSGGSVANLIGLAVMRHVKTQGQVRATGLTGEKMIVYTSAQGHSCIQKAVELLGLGSQQLRKIPTDKNYRMDVAALKRQIEQDKAAGLRPVAVAASAGTVNTGAIDPLNEIADLCAAEDLWLHVDGAYGGVGILAAPELYQGIERADSIAVDPHKWLYVPIECGCTLVKDQQAMRNTFSLVPPYLRDDTALPWFSEFGIQQTRTFRALKLWMVMQQVGLAGYRQLIQRDMELTRLLTHKIRQRDDFEVVATGDLSIVCFRYAPMGIAGLDTLNRRLLEIVQRSGDAFLISTELDGKLVLRGCIVNFRTREADLDRLLDSLAEAGQQVITDMMVR